MLYRLYLYKAKKIFVYLATTNGEIKFMCAIYKKVVILEYAIGLK